MLAVSDFDMQTVYCFFTDIVSFVRPLMCRAISAFFVSMFIAIFTAPIIIDRLRQYKIEQVLRDQSEVRELANLHMEKQNTPTIGGLIVIIPTIIATSFFVNWNLQVILTVSCYLIMAAIGFADDILKITKKNTKGVPGRIKLLLQLLISFVVVTILYFHSRDLFERCMSPVIPFTEMNIILPSFFVSVIFFFFIFAGTSNSVNLTDGLDGLATGCAIPVLIFFGFMTVISVVNPAAKLFDMHSVCGSEELIVVCASALGASIVFLWLNGFPATIFMGDTGSLSLGALIAMTAFFSGYVLHLVVAGGIFVIEALSDIIQVGSRKLYNGRRVFRMAPIHHHFELGGNHESKITIRFWIISYLFVTLAIFSFFPMFRT